MDEDKKNIVLDALALWLGKPTIGSHWALAYSWDGELFYRGDPVAGRATRREETVITICEFLDTV